MLKRFCDFCGAEINVYYPDLDRDSKTQFYTLIKYRGESDERECDICNECLNKILGALKNERSCF